jgi:PIN domain nuclease of toxin-antitoxin system
VLLDTHVAIWFLEDPAQLAGEARAVIEDAENVVHLSAVSVWETAIKQAAGRIAMPEALDRGAARVGFTELAVTWQHGRVAAALPSVHRDPFDRMLVAQAQTEDLVLLTRDADVRRYDIATMPA